MASSPPSSVRSDPTGAFDPLRESNSSFTSAFDTSLENNHGDPAHLTTSSIYIDAPLMPSIDMPYELLQGFSAPTQPVYINMGGNDSSSDVSFSRPATTTSMTEIPLSRSLASIDVDHPLPSQAIQRHGHHHHHFPHHAQNRNRYPYLQRPVSSRGLNRSQGAPSSIDALTYLEQRPAFRRSYFALRRQRIPRAPPMPKHLFPGFKQNRPVAITSEPTVDENGAREGEDDDDEDQPPTKSLWVILRLVFFFFAIEFMYAVETALTVPILTALRVPESFYSMAWLISPILGFFLQPIIGMWSDMCKCRWGRRRPFILAFAIGAFIGTSLLLNGADIGVLVGDSKAATSIPYGAIVATVIGVTLLDFCADSADVPIRAYLIDTTNPADQERGFNIHAILGGFGGGFGFIIGAIHWPSIAIFDKSGGEFSVIFLASVVLFVVCTISTLTSVREEPLISTPRVTSDTTNDDDDVEIDTDEKRPLLSLRRNSSRLYSATNKADRSTSNIYMNDLNQREGFMEFDASTGNNVPHDHVERNNEEMLLQTLERTHQVIAASMVPNDPDNPVPVPTGAFETELKQKAKLVKLGLMRRSTIDETEDDDEKDQVTLKSMLISMVRMPARLWKLMICQVIGWVAYFATHLYFTDFMAREVYNGTLDANDTMGFELYKKGVAMGCWGLFVYSASAALYAFCLERWLSEKFSLKTLYFLGYLLYAVGCIVNYFVHNVVVNIAMCVTFGILTVSLNTLPYHMLSSFHADETYKNRDGSKRGIGVDCSLLNSCYFLGELIVAACLGFVIERTGVNTCMLIGAAAALIGNVSMGFLFYFNK